MFPVGSALIFWGVSLYPGYLPNGVHAVEAMLAAASIGAIWSSTSVDFGINVRFDLCLLRPKCLYTLSYRVHGKLCLHQPIIAGLA